MLTSPAGQSAQVRSEHVTHLCALFPIGYLTRFKRLEQSTQQGRIAANNRLRRQFIDGYLVRVRPTLGCEQKLVFVEQIALIMLGCSL